MEISDLSVWINLAVFLSGLFIGNRLAIGRDRRREYNAVAERLRKELTQFLERPDPYRSFPSRTELSEFALFLSVLQRRRFQVAVDECFHAMSGTNQVRDSVGQVHFDQEQVVEASVRKLLKYVRRK